MLKYRSIEPLICSPKMEITPASKKKRAPRAIIEQITKGIKEILQNPAVRVAALYGMGVKPAASIAHHSCYRYCSAKYANIEGETI